ncbi:hypothetical protein HOS07_gp02 [Cronobacter phage ESSI-2]|uniref:Uncharacterized protein n=1 Tax=Cronobacter phage ESSI-2 TaxID=947842 RepID=F1BUJ8_9CAUD|nr:hypothetical protein HOS07_gp02 [Cronobacter phage ESSI-2]ADX32390.1 hypothetical protein [Cronobacter phage ESSI-2]
MAGALAGQLCQQVYGIQHHLQRVNAFAADVYRWAHNLLTARRDAFTQLRDFLGQPAIGLRLNAALRVRFLLAVNFGFGIAFHAGQKFAAGCDGIIAGGHMLNGTGQQADRSQYRGFIRGFYRGFTADQLAALPVCGHFAAHGCFADGLVSLAHPVTGLRDAL